MSAHTNIPFHRVQMWNGKFFEQLDLLSHAMFLDLRHYPDNCPSYQHHTEDGIISDLDVSDEGNECVDTFETRPTKGWRTQFQSRSNLIVVSSTSIFKRSVQWCHCAKSSDQYVQLLLHARLFPASFKNPQTVFTFEVLDHFRINALECKTLAMNFMSKIQHITNEAFLSHVPVSILIH